MQTELGLRKMDLVLDAGRADPEAYDRARPRRGRYRGDGRAAFGEETL
jgi:hypothetical protein